MWRLILLLLSILVGTYPTGGWLRLQGRNLVSEYGCLSRSMFIKPAKKGLVHEAFQGLNLNLPPARSGVSGPDIINVNSEPQNVLPEPKSSSTMELVDSVAEVNQNKEQEVEFPINDSLLVGFGDKSSSPSASGSPISYPIIDLTEKAPADSSMRLSAPVAMQAPLQDVRGNYEVEMSLLQELEEMGFHQVDLNKEILRKNEYDLEQSIDDLCGVAEWDPILEVLEEMIGFLRQGNEQEAA